MSKFRFWLALAALVLLLSAAGSAAVTASPTARSQSALDKIAADLQAALAALPPGGRLTVIVTLRDQADFADKIGAAELDGDTGWLVRALKARASSSQQPLVTLLEQAQRSGRAGGVTPFWVFNGVAVSATADLIAELAARPDVLRITPDDIRVVPAGLADVPPEANVTAIEAPALWEMGWRGQGVVIATLDTGADATHPDLAERWRGGSNSWFDPYGQHPQMPVDRSGHGTQVLGILVGGGAGGTAIGVAPEAEWIAAKIFDDRGRATATAIHQAFQWVLDPDGNPDTADAPDVVNNSWTFDSPGCNLEFQYDLRALRAAGILPVFAAGNFGPNAATSASPANNPEAFAVGATSNTGLPYFYSSRGPSACGETASLYPDLAAPGIGVHTTDLYGFYTTATGTSAAAPHVLGALALLLSAYPGLSAERQGAALRAGALDVGALGPDNETGSGFLDVLAAYRWLAGPEPIPGALFADGFESGDLSAWSDAAMGGGRLAVSQRAALEGRWGLEAQIRGTTPLYAVDDSPSAEKQYYAWFRFDPNGTRMKTRSSHDIFVGRDVGGAPLVRIEIREIVRSYQVRGVVREGSGAERSTEWHSLTDAAHTVEVLWEAASSPDRADGGLTLWLDGEMLEALRSVANGAHRLESGCLGPQNVSPGVSGTEFFDAFVSMRTPPDQ